MCVTVWGSLSFFSLVIRFPIWSDTILMAAKTKHANQTSIAYVAFWHIKYLDQLIICSPYWITMYICVFLVHGPFSLYGINLYHLHGTQYLIEKKTFGRIENIPNISPIVIRAPLFIPIKGHCQLVFVLIHFPLSNNSLTKVGNLRVIFDK